MNILLALVFISLTVYGFLKKREYVLAIILVGQPIIKLFLKPLPNSMNENIALLVYFCVGFFSLSIIRLANKKKIRLDDLSKKNIILYFLFCLIILISLIYTPDKAYGLNKFIEFFSTTILIIFIGIITVDNEISFYKTMHAIANISIVIGLLTILIVYFETGGLLVRLGTSQAKEIQLLGINFVVSIWFGRRIGIAFLAMLFITLIDRSKWNIIKTIILLMLLILSVSRGPIISMLFTLFLIVIVNMLSKGKNKKLYKRFFIFLTLCIGVVAVTIFINIDSAFSRLTSFEDGNVLSRLNMYLLSIKLIKENLLGYGIGSFKYLSYGIHEYPHNLFLEVLVELGILGFILMIIGIVLNIKRYLYFRKRDIETKHSFYLDYSFGILIFAIMNSLFSGDIISNEYIWLGFIILGRCIGLIQGKLEVISFNR